MLFTARYTWLDDVDLWPGITLPQPGNAFTADT